MSANSPEEIRSAFITMIARRLHESGAAVHRLEGAVRAVADALNVDVDILATPTALSISFNQPEGAPRTHLLRVSPGDVNLARLCDVDEVAAAVSCGAMDAAGGMRALAELERAPPVYPASVQALAWGVNAAAVGLLLQLTWPAIAVAFLLGTGLALLHSHAGVRLSESGSFEALSGLLAAMIAVSLARAGLPIDAAVTVMASIIILIPGLSLTTAVTELSTSHWSAGTARLAGALVTLLKLVFGVVLGQRLAALVMPEGEWLALQGAALPSAELVWVALPLAGCAFGVIFAARLRDLWLVVGIALISYVVTRFGTANYGPEVGIFLAAFLVAVTSNLFARIMDRPATLLRVPGVILLVPGLLSFRSLGSLYGGSTELSATTALAALAALTFLMGGLLLGNAFVPPRRHL